MPTNSTAARHRYRELRAFQCRCCGHARRVRHGDHRRRRPCTWRQDQELREHHRQRARRHAHRQRDREQAFGRQGRRFPRRVRRRDILDGGEGNDTASYENSDAAVTVSLSTNTGIGGHAQGDKLISIENLYGSDFKDKLTGNAFANLINGGGDGIWAAYLTRNGNHVYPARAITRAELDEVSDAEFESVLSVRDEFSKMSASQLRNYTHKYCAEYTEVPEAVGCRSRIRASSMR